MAKLNKVVKNFRAYYIASELGEAAWTLEDAWLEYCQIKPDETEDIKLSTIRKSADAEDWHQLRQEARTKFQNKFRDGVVSKAKEVNADVIKALGEKVATEIALLDNTLVNLISKFDIDAMTIEERLKLTEILLKHSSRISDNFVKMFTNKDGLPPMFSKMLGQAMTQAQTTQGSDEGPTVLDGSNPYDLDVELGLMKNTIDGKPIAAVPPPSKSAIGAIETKARIKPKKVADEDDGYEEGDDEDE